MDELGGVSLDRSLFKFSIWAFIARNNFYFRNNCKNEDKTDDFSLSETDDRYARYGRTVPVGHIWKFDLNMEV